METLFLSRHNLETLINKLDAVQAGKHSHCTIIKADNRHPKYPQSMNSCTVIAKENSDYYDDRPPGEVVHYDINKTTNTKMD